ncbi:MAG: nitronate monooxygenase [Myxococcota bacterium]|jgi:enoyl-[acyl-carrier protein] reductase II
MKTKITEMLGIKYPIFCSGMSWIATPELVAAVSNAGGCGILATGVSTVEQTREAVRRTKQLTDKPFAANLTLYFPGAQKNAQVLFDEKVPIINYALGKGDWIVKAVHAYGGKVIATVTTHKHALAAQRDGADALIVTGYEAAGHGGAITSMVLIPAIADELKIPVIAAGGIADGRGFAAAIALGAEGISMGTRFMNTVESPCHENMKKLCVQKEIYDTIYTDKVDGLPARFMKSKASMSIIKRRLNPLSALFNSRKIAAILGLPWGKLFLGIILSGYQKAVMMARMAIGFEAFQVGTINGDNEKGVLPLGQIGGIIKDTPTVAEAIDRIVAEAETAIRRTQCLL